MYTQPSPVGMEPANVPVTHHEAMFHHPNHGMGDHGMNHGAGGGMYGGGMVQYDGVPQQQGMFIEDGTYPPPNMPPQHYHPQQHAHPPPMSPGGHRLPPPMMVSMLHHHNMLMCGSSKHKCFYFINYKYGKY